MAINSYGYPDLIAAGADLSRFSSNGFGHTYSAIGFGDLRVTISGTGTRRVNIASGWAMGKGVMVNSTAQEFIELPAPAGSSQWFLIGLKRWTADGFGGYLSELVSVAGTASRAVPTVAQTAGSDDTQWLALARVATGQTLVQEVVDLRLVSTEGAGFYVCYSDLAMLQLENFVGAEVYRADTASGHTPAFYKRLASTSGTLSWKNLTVAETVKTGTEFTDGAAFPGWSQGSEQRLVANAHFIWVHLELTKSGGQITATSQGSLGSNQDLVTLSAPYRPLSPVSGSAYVTSDAGVERNAGVRISSAGVVQVTSAEPGAVVRSVTVDAVFSRA